LRVGEMVRPKQPCKPQLLHLARQPLPSLPSQPLLPLDHDRNCYHPFLLCVRDKQKVEPQPQTPQAVCGWGLPLVLIRPPLSPAKLLGRPRCLDALPGGRGLLTSALQPVAGDPCLSAQLELAEA